MVWAKIVRIGGGDHLGLALGNLDQDISHDVEPASLPCSAGQSGDDGVHQAAVVVGDHQLGPAQSPVAQGPQELSPEVPGFGVADRAPQNLPAVGGHTGGDDHGLGDDPGTFASFVATSAGDLQHVASKNTYGNPARPGPGC